MSTHLYCVLPGSQAAALPPGLRGVNDAPVHAVPVEDLVAWVSDIERGVPVTIDGVKAHDAVVQAALDTGATPVPARYGQRFENDDAFREAIARRSPAIRALLAGLQGFVEMTLLLTPSTTRMIKDLRPVVPEMVGEGAGRQYMETLRAREAATGTVRRALDALAQRLTEAVQRFSRGASVQEDLARMPMRTVSHLVPRDAVDAYRASLADVRAPADSQFVVIGPRAPYSFSTLRPDHGSHGMRLAD